MRGIKFEKKSRRDLCHLGEISLISPRARRDLCDNTNLPEISARSRQFYRDRVEIAGLSLFFVLSYGGSHVFLSRRLYAFIFLLSVHPIS